MAGSFGIILILILINLHALLSLDRFSVPPFAQHVWCIQSSYLGLALLCVVGALLPLVVECKAWFDLLLLMTIVVRLAYVLVSCGAWYLSNADGWTLHFPVAAIGISCLNNGLLYRQNIVTILVSAAVFGSCLLSELAVLALPHFVFHLLHISMVQVSIFEQVNRRVCVCVCIYIYIYLYIYILNNIL